MITDPKEAIRKRLAEIESANDGRLTPFAVVADARDETSPLHDCFEWDVDKASYSHWITQARNLITSIRVVVTTESTSVKSVFYVRDPSAQQDEQGYVSVTRLRGDKDMAREALVAEFTRVADLLRRARHLAQALDADDEIQGLIQTVVGLRQRFMPPPAPMQ